MVKIHVEVYNCPNHLEFENSPGLTLSVLLTWDQKEGKQENFYQTKVLNLIHFNGKQK